MASSRPCLGQSFRTCPEVVGLNFYLSIVLYQGVVAAMHPAWVSVTRPSQSQGVFCRCPCLRLCHSSRSWSFQCALVQLPSLLSCRSRRNLCLSSHVCFCWLVSRVVMIQDHSHQYVVKELLTKLLCGNPKRFIPTDVQSSRTIRHDLELAARYFQGSMLHAICLRIARVRCLFSLRILQASSR